MRHSRYWLAFLLLVSPGCGSGGPSEAPTTRFDGQVVDANGQGLGEVEVYLFDTNESSVTDESGQFSIESFKHSSSGSLFFKAGSFTNRVELGEFPADTLVVRARVEVQSSLGNARLLSVEFSSELTPVEPPTPTPAPGETPAAKPTATPAALFDPNGNTSGFGIPGGLTGNINAGKGVWNGQCASCHAAEKKNRGFGQIKASLRVVPTMQSLRLSSKQIADVTAYLNRNRR